MNPEQFTTGVVEDFARKIALRQIDPAHTPGSTGYFGYRVGTGLISREATELAWEMWDVLNDHTPALSGVTDEERLAVKTGAAEGRDHEPSWNNEHEQLFRDAHTLGCELAERFVKKGQNEGWVDSDQHMIRLSIDVDGILDSLREDIKREENASKMRNVHAAALAAAVQVS
jgi:hypothetical protein